MKYQTNRALYYTFATQEIEKENTTLQAWRQIAELFGVPVDERQYAEKLLSDPIFMELKTAEDVRLVQKCENGFGGGLQRLAENLDDEVLELKYQALLKIKQFTNEQRTAPFKAVAAAYRCDSTAAVLYALQILARNKDRKELGCRILSEALFTDQNTEAGIILLNIRHGNVGATFSKLAETPEMILHPEVLEELARMHDINPATVQKDGTRIGF